MANAESFRAATPNLSRNQLLAFCYFLLMANAMPSFIVEAVALRGWLSAALNLFDVSAIIWLAMIACLALLWRSDDCSPPAPHDWVIAACAAMVSLLPFSALSGAALGVFGILGIVRHPTGSDARRASAIVISLSAFFFWGRAFLALGAGPVLSADAQLISWISGLSAQDNVVVSADGSRFVIAPGCSSLHGISLAIVLWTTALAWFSIRPTSRWLMCLVAAILASIGINAMRLVTIGWNPEHFDYWHTGGGAILYGWIALLVVTAIVYFGIKNELAKT